VPPGWKKFTITRKFRGATYKIKVSNPDGAMRGVKKMLVNGKVQPGNLVEVFKPGSIVNVEIYLG
jgi:cellobiose phosphorylase